MGGTQVSSFKGYNGRRFLFINQIIEGFLWMIVDHGDTGLSCLKLKMFGFIQGVVLV